MERIRNQLQGLFPGKILRNVNSSFRDIDNNYERATATGFEFAIDVYSAGCL
jgi:hypothetical protein